MATLAYFTFLLLLGVSTATKSRHPTKSFESWYSVDQPPPLPFEAVQSVVDFPPDGFVARHTHGGPLYAIMIHGSTILWIDGEPAKISHKGDPLEEPYGSISSAANSGTGEASLLATYLIPVGANLTTFVPGEKPSTRPGPSSRFRSRMRLEVVPKRYKVHVFLQTYEKGVWTVPEEVEAPRLVTVVTGEVTTFGRDGKGTFKVGEFWIERPGERALVSGNLGMRRPWWRFPLWECNKFHSIAAVFSLFRVILWKFMHSCLNFE